MAANDFGHGAKKTFPFSALRGAEKFLAAISIIVFNEAVAAFF